MGLGAESAENAIYAPEAPIRAGTCANSSKLTAEIPSECEADDYEGSSSGAKAKVPKTKSNASNPISEPAANQTHPPNRVARIATRLEARRASLHSSPRRRGASERYRGGLLRSAEKRAYASYSVAVFRFDARGAVIASEMLIPRSTRFRIVCRTVVMIVDPPGAALGGRTRGSC
jgi:hypothetical protein